MFLQCLFFFFNDTATTEIYTLSLHDALPILVEARIARPEIVECDRHARALENGERRPGDLEIVRERGFGNLHRSEEHTSELQSRQYLVCRLLLEKKKIKLIEEEHVTLPMRTP